MGRVTKKFLNDIVRMYEVKNCNVSNTCTGMNISRDTFYRYKKQFPAFAKELDNVYEAQQDWAESKLIGAINAGDIPSLHFYLRTKGRERGYDTSQNIHLSGKVQTQSVEFDVQKEIQKAMDIMKAQGKEISYEALMAEIEQNG